MIWGGRFEESLDDIALKFSSSFNIDINLFYEDIQVSIVYSSMLYRIGLITHDEMEKIHHGLIQIKENYEKDKNYFNLDEYEDVHSAIEDKLFQIIGETAAKLHTGRSRNDLIATDMRLWVKKLCKIVQNSILNLQKSIIQKASENIDTLMFGYTHLQRAQPISFAFYLLAYYDMLERDFNQFEQNFLKIKYCPLGSSAFAGSTLNLDSEFLAKSLGFEAPYNNAMDAVADRDFMLDFLNAVNIGMIHLSRLSEDLIIYSTQEFNFIKLSDKYTTGSSLMPQKKNPDMLELIRGKSASVTGNYTSFSMLLKALPMSYNRDLQEDKKLLWEAFNTYNDSLNIMNGVISTLECNKNRYEKDILNDFSIATDIADYLVKKGVAFRIAHKQVGILVKYAEKHSKKLIEITNIELENLKIALTSDELFEIINSNPLYRKQTKSSPNPNFVKERIDLIKVKLRIN
jgi:argininosuccinate lyase